ncbi:PLDc N-terminal domain-containing protein [Acrocarpospora macrocephala]|uniref:Membrane protein n=1 Tax=Acrocarpospora macrocephala TaxID=150177 RepID=A0A5M3X365_9ACTN|nr:PLDc N-terminal domain-containing protein [Acrocarpospora macrocephala]GES14539.1 membrane protein [Acrocarpospora macrocephala]
MVIIRGVIVLVLIGLWLYCVLDVITTEPDRIRNMPKVLWLLVVILLPTAGSLLWLIAGRPRLPRGYTTYTGQNVPPREVRRLSPDDDEEFLRKLRERAEEQRRSAREKADPESPDAPKPEPAPDE